MSQLARVFVVVNFLLAAGFLYAASMFLGLNADWKGKHKALDDRMKQEVDSLNRNIKEQKTRVDELTRESQTAKEENASLKTGMSQLQAANTTAESDKKAKDATIAQAQGNVASSTAALQRAQEELAKRTTDADKLRTDAQTAQDNERKANDELTKTKDQVRERDNKIAELEKNKTDLSAKVDELEIVKRIAQQAGVDVGALVLQPAIADAKVIGVDMNMKLVQVNAGSAQKISRGATLDIVRGGNYVGRITIDQVYPTSSAGTISVLKSGETVQVGDRATNTLN
jgi:uncharacterized protein (DUF3084 family)